ncbi:MAG: S-layer homology domain-containing protein [Firmicutes bacterium]|nr:S-layer homology domain-containing protein [Bacillota bacterium]
MLKKHNKLVVLAVLLTFLFSIVGTASAAPIPTDIKGKNYEQAVTELAALDILTGYPDGTFKADNKITRAEFAAVAVRLLGLEKSAQFTKGDTPFSDVTAAHWASGYINVAVDQGLLKGYPDGTFKPEANVTYAEAVAILVRALGYEPAIKGAWPTGYLAKGNEIGVTDDVTVVANAPANRGDVAIMTDNSLDIPMMYQATYGTGDVEYRNDDPNKTILTEKLDLYVVKEKDVTKAPKIARGDIKANEIVINGTTYEVAPGIDPNKYIGLNVTAWVDDRSGGQKDLVKYIKIETESDRYFTDRAKNTDTYDGGTNYIYLNEKDKAYELYEKGIFYLNGESVTRAAFESNINKTAASGRFVINDADQIIFADVWQYSPSNAVVTEVGADYIKYWNPADATTDAEEPTIKKLSFTDEDYTYVLMRSGATVDLKAVQVGDLVSIYEDEDDDFLFATFGPKKVTGKLDEVFKETYKSYGDTSNKRLKLTINGKEYFLASNAVASTNSGEEIKLINNNAENLEDLIGADVTVYLTTFNEVQYIVGKVESKADNYALVLGVSTGTLEDKVKLFKQDGTIVTLECTNDTDYINVPDGPDTESTGPEIANEFEDLQPGQLVKYSVASDGTVDEIEYVGNVGAGTAIATRFDDDDDYIVTGSGNYYVTDSTIIFNWSDYNTSKDEDDLSIVKWEDLEDKDGSATVLVYCEDGNEATVVVLVSGYNAIAGDDYVGVVKKVKYNGDDYVVTVDVEGTEKTYVVANDTEGAKLAEADVIAFSVSGSGKLTGIDGRTAIDTFNFGTSKTIYDNANNAVFQAIYDTVYAVSGKSIQLKSGAMPWYTTNSATIYYDIEDGDAEELGFGDVDKDDPVLVIIDSVTKLVKAVIFKGDK